MSIERLLAAEDLRSLVGAYLVAADRGRSRDLASLFAADGVLEIRGGGPDEGTHRGPDAIMARLEANRAELAQLMDGTLLRHHVSSIRIDLDDQAAPRGSSYFLAVTSGGPDHWGRYADRYQLVDGAWLFAHRVVHVEGWAPDSWMARSRAATAEAGS